MHEAPLRQCRSGFNRVLFHFRSQEKRKDDVTHLEETPTKSNLSVKVASSIGFSSASGKPVNISSKALDQAKKLFQDLDEKDTANDIAAQDFKVRHQGKAGLTPGAEQEVVLNSFLNKILNLQLKTKTFQSQTWDFHQPLERQLQFQVKHWHRQKSFLKMTQVWSYRLLQMEILPKLGLLLLQERRLKYLVKH